jgi:hypothetical protein
VVSFIAGIIQGKRISAQDSEAGKLFLFEQNARDKNSSSCQQPLDPPDLHGLPVE